MRGTIRHNRCAATFVVVLATLFGGCEQEVVRDFRPSSAAGALSKRVHVAEFPLVADTVLCADSIYTKNQSDLLVGRHWDAHFGEVIFYAFFQLSEVNSFTDIPADAVLEAINIDFVVNYGHLSAEPSPIFGLYELSEPIETKDYFANDRLSYDDTKTALVQPAVAREGDNDERFSSSITGGWATTFFSYFQGKSAPLRNLKGLALAPTTQSTSIRGFHPEQSVLNIRYRRHTNDNDVLVKKLTLSGPRFNRVVADRRNSTLATIGETIVFPHERYAFLQGGTGICVQLAIEPLLRIKDVIGVQSTIVSVELSLSAHLTTLQDDALLPGAIRMSYHNSAAGPTQPLRMASLLDRVVPNDQGYALVNNARFNLLRVEAQTPSYGGSLVIFTQALLAGDVSATHLVLIPQQYDQPVQGIFRQDGIKVRVYYTKTTE